MSITHPTIAGPKVESTDYYADHTITAGSVTPAQIAATGTPGSTTALFGDGTWKAPGGGGSLVLLEQHTASSSSSLDFTTAITSTYDDYLIEIVNLLAGSAQALEFEVSSDGGSTWDTSGGHYEFSHFVYSSAGTAVGGGTAQNVIQAYPYSTRQCSTSLAFSGSIHLYHPASTASAPTIIGDLNGGDSVTSNTSQRLVLSGGYHGGTAINALRFILASGNIASGTIRMYGLAKS